MKEITESTIVGPSISLNYTPEEGLLINPNLFSSQLNRLRLARREFKEPQELDSTLTTTLR